eukprot:3927006-Rhodomonas_salina.1
MAMGGMRTTLSCSEMMAGESTRRWVASTSDTLHCTTIISIIFCQPTPSSCSSGLVEDWRGHGSDERDGEKYEGGPDRRRARNRE